MILSHLDPLCTATGADFTDRPSACTPIGASTVAAPLQLVVGCRGGQVDLELVALCVLVVVVAPCVLAILT